MIEAAVVLPRLFAEGPGALRVNILLETGSFTALVGPSGSGKTTLLRVLAGLETPQQGKIVANEAIWFDTGQRINMSPQRRSIGYVFQDTALFPNMTVRENIAYGASAGRPSAVTHLIDATGLGPFAAKKPGLLSGGQRQRVALARALVRRPQLLLLDEPFAALDADAAGALRRVLLHLHREWGTTTVLVSHYEADVKALADRVIRLVQGQVQTEDVMAQPPAIQLPRENLFRERIQSIQFDTDRQRWIIQTDTTQLESTNPVWSQLTVGTFIELSWTK